MNYNKDKIDMNESLKDLKQKLMALDMLMNSGVKLICHRPMDKSAINSYSESNPFTAGKNIIS
jgi:cell fate (sporulation/competence/biofilm development) regulator YlbF (YheA/YmcA/DUF963 family)